MGVDALRLFDVFKSLALFVLSPLLVRAAVAQGATPTPPDVLRQPLIDVPVGLSEALLGADVGVPRARVATYHTVVSMAWRRAAALAAECGYGLRVLREDYDGGTPLGPAAAVRALVDKGAWITLGGSQTKQSLFAATAAGPMPFVAPLAANSSVETMGENAFGGGLDPEVGMAQLLDILQERNYGRTFAVVRNTFCHTCAKFSKTFVRHAEKRGLRLVGEFVYPDSPIDHDTLARDLAPLQFDFIVLPGSARTMFPTFAALKDSKRKVRLVGDGAWPLFKPDMFHRRPLPESFEGVERRDWASEATIARLRALLPDKVSTEFDPSFVSRYDFVILRFFEEVAMALCLERPASREAFWMQSRRWDRQRFVKGVQPGFFLLSRDGYAPLRVPLSSTVGGIPWLEG